ncbi:hypothetical protein ACJJIX_16625 [Microbulbifer sp. VAAC004]|uniref:hypothetical protein n=1 Tax=unclassified Microbulbifer TaxID=2619833 RepID=UPI00403B00F5
MIVLSKDRRRKSKVVGKQLDGLKGCYSEFLQHIDAHGLMDELKYHLSSKRSYNGSVVKILNAMQSLGSYSDQGDVLGFFTYSIRYREKYGATLSENVNRLNYYDLFSYLEWQLQRLAHKNIGYDNRVANEHVSASMFSSLTSTIPWIVMMLDAKELVSGGKKKLSKRNSVGKKIISSAGYYRTISNEISNIFRGEYKVLSGEKFFHKYRVSESLRLQGFEKMKYFLDLYNKEWRPSEIYRDLNFQYYHQREENKDIILELGRRAGFIKSDDLKKEIRFDFDKGYSFQRLMSFQKVRASLSVVYGDIYRKFRFGDSTYCIDDLVVICEALDNVCRRYSKANKSRVGKGNAEIFCGNKNQLMKALGVSSQKEKLLSLFVFDLVGKVGSLSFDAPIYRAGLNYYFIPRYVMDLMYEKLIDRILSGNDVGLDFDRGVHKGHVFEEYLKEELGEAGYAVNSIKMDQRKGVPEIDGLFRLGSDHLVIYEAKASIPPEERDEAYRFVDNHISKALDQLDKRVEFVQQSPGMIEERVGYPVKNLEVIPLIVSNAHYFSGSRFTTPGGIDVWFLDATTFLRILCQSKINSWTAVGDKREYMYRYANRPLTTVESKISAIKKPYQYLRSVHQSTVQILDHGVGFEIAHEVSVL